MNRKKQKWEEFGINEWWDKRRENWKGAQSQPLLMQIVVPVKESREAKKVPFNVVTDTHVSAHMHFKGDLKDSGIPRKTEKRGTRGSDDSKENKKAVIGAQTSSVILTLCTCLDPVVRPLFRNVPFSRNLAPPLCLILFRLRWHNKEEAEGKNRVTWSRTSQYGPD